MADEPEKKEIKLNTEAPSIWEALSPDKAKKFATLVDILFHYVISDLQLGQMQKFVTLENFLKSEQFGKLELEFETDNDYICLGFAMALAFRGVEDKVRLSQIQQQQSQENQGALKEPKLIIPNGQRKDPKKPN